MDGARVHDILVVVHFFNSSRRNQPRYARRGICIFGCGSSIARAARRGDSGRVHIFGASVRHGLSDEASDVPAGICLPRSRTVLGGKCPESRPRHFSCPYSIHYSVRTFYPNPIDREIPTHLWRFGIS